MDHKQDHEIMFLLDLDDRASLRECPTFSGMEGTSTWAIELSDYFVGHDQIIVDPVRAIHKKGETRLCFTSDWIWFGSDAGGD